MEERYRSRLEIRSADMFLSCLHTGSLRNCSCADPANIRTFGRRRAAFSDFSLQTPWSWNLDHSSVKRRGFELKTPTRFVLVLPSFVECPLGSSHLRSRPGGSLLGSVRRNEPGQLRAGAVNKLTRDYEWSGGRGQCACWFFCYSWDKKNKNCWLIPPTRNLTSSERGQTHCGHPITGRSSLRLLSVRFNSQRRLRKAKLHPTFKHQFKQKAGFFLLCGFCFWQDDEADLLLHRMDAWSTGGRWVRSLQDKEQGLTCKAAGTATFVHEGTVLANYRNLCWSVMS